MRWSDIGSLEHVVRNAGEIMRKTPRDVVMNKGDAANYCTECDLAIERYLDAELTRLLPGSEVFGEESHSAWERGGLHWIVDPLDGTANFNHRLCASTISVALMADGEIVQGVIYDPENDRCFTASQGGGAFLNGEPRQVSDRPFANSLAFVQLGVYKKADAEIGGAAILRLFHACEDVRSFGSAALELAWLGAGSAELFYAPRLYPWDFAAACVIIREAGGQIGTTAPGGLLTGLPLPVVAANTPENFERLQELIRPV